ncbi:hypothetical protein PPACK8108_LOCUS2345 [Phakopsora pachyrhizi]|uniref:Uncharacterized protein n=1 Tax=Phakopsora pachyrhizi TaxID=170000 RepID=A0AAV0AIU9_PHAPC|nr:hypothetical protein PPACK8108_LOCUS2345 [Phakopsora pachyrhizi]
MVSPTSGAVYHVAFYSLGLTLVLPQVAKGRMGSCSAYPFKLYYNSDVLNRLGVPTITHAQFQIWAWRRSPSARMVSISDCRGASSDIFDITPSNEMEPAQRIMDLLWKDAVKPRMEKSPTASIPDILVFNYKL